MDILNFPSASATSLAIALTSLLLTIVYCILKWRDLPPGPVGLPFLGIWPFLDDNTLHLKMNEYKKKYGDVYSFTISGRLYISLGSAKVVREAQITKSDCFGARISEFSLLSYIFEDGVIDASGESWKVLRKYFQQVLKQYGMVPIKDHVSEFIHDSVQATLDFLKSKQDEPVNIVEFLMKQCGAIICQTMFGERGTTHKKINKLNEHSMIVLDSMTPCLLLLSGKIAKYLIFPLNSLYRACRKNMKCIRRVLYQMLDEHESTYDEEHIRDVIDEFLRERNDRRSKGDPTAQYFTSKALMSTLLQILGDGVVAVIGFILILLNDIVAYPDEQEKMLQELLEIVGADRLPTLEDKSRLPYTNAFILESLRKTEAFSIFPTLECTKETTLHGYRIPKGAMLLMSTWCAHHDPSVYENPEKFDPSRFQHTKDKQRAELPISFGIGKRSCLGEGFVMSQAFLFLTAIIRDFRLTPGEGSAENSVNLVVPGKTKIQVYPRRSS